MPDLTAQRAGIPAACWAHIRTVMTHIDALFFDANGQRIPAWQADPSFMLHCWNQAHGQGLEVWTMAIRGDVEGTHQACQAWWSAVKQARDAHGMRDVPVAEEEQPHG